MNHHRALATISEHDERLLALPPIAYTGTFSDASHAQRRCQQRGISATMLRIALGYGRREHHKGLQRWTLLRRDLRTSPYARYEAELHGLRLVGWQCPAHEIVRLKTCLWVWDLRRH